MKPILKAALLSATFAMAGVAYAAGPTAGPTLPNSATTPPVDSNTDTATPPTKPTDTDSGSMSPSSSTPPDATTNTNTNDSRQSDMDHNRTGYSSGHHGNMHTASSHRYRSQCSNLRAQWQDASVHHRHMSHYASAKRIAMKGEHACKSRSSASMKTGVMRLRTAIRRLGEKPSI